MDSSDEDSKKVETLENMEAPLPPTPFSIFCTMVKRKDISWCRKQFPLLPDQERLKWIDLALAEGANYREEFEKFKAKNPHLKPKMTPILNEKEKLLVHIRDEKPIKPHWTSHQLFASEWASMPTRKGESKTRMTHWSASWNTLRKAEKTVYEERVAAMKHEYIAKLSAFLSNLPIEKRREEIANCLMDAYGLITKKAAGTDKKSEPAFSDEKDHWTIDSSDESSEELVDDINDSSDSERKKSVLACTESGGSSKKAKFGTGNRHRSGTASSTSSESEGMARVSSRRFKSPKKIENTSDEDELNSPEGDESSGLSDLSSSHKEKSTLKSLKKTSLAVDSSDESDDGRKFSAYLVKPPAERRSQNHYNYYLPDGKGIKRKKRAETDESSASSKTLKLVFSDQSDSDSSEEEPSALSTDENSNNSDDEISPKKKEIYPFKWILDSSEELSD